VALAELREGGSDGVLIAKRGSGGWLRCGWRRWLTETSANGVTANGMSEGCLFAAAFDSFDVKDLRTGGASKSAEGFDEGG
jgi:hypothetical protein